MALGSFSVTHFCVANNQLMGFSMQDKANFPFLAWGVIKQKYAINERLEFYSHFIFDYPAIHLFLVELPFFYSLAYY